MDYLDERVGWVDGWIEGMIGKCLNGLMDD